LIPFIFLFLLILFEVYLFSAFITAGRDSSKLLRSSLIITYTVVTLVFYGAILMGMMSGSRGIGVGKFIQGYTITLIGTFLLGEDMFRGFQWIADKVGNADQPIDLSRKRFLSRLALVVGSIPVLTLLNGTIRSAYRFKVYKTNVPIKGIPETLKGLHIVQLSDLHAGSMIFENRLAEAVDTINKLNPDLIFFTGDMVNSVAKEAEVFIPILSKLKAKYGVYSVLGNHDYGDYHNWANKEEKIANLDLLKDIQKKMGWQLLNNANNIINVNGHDVAVIGVENWSNRRYFPAYGKLDKAYAGCETCDLRLLLSHDPTHWREEVLKKYKDIHITFSGHTHGFQFGVEIPWLKWSPAKYAYPEWAGLYEETSQFLYVNRGIGHLGYPGRVGILPEITSLTIS